jgi:hypothetical protein
MNWEGSKRRRSLRCLRYYFIIFLEEPRKHTYTSAGISELQAKVFISGRLDAKVGAPHSTTTVGARNYYEIFLFAISSKPVLGVHPVSYARLPGALRDKTATE